MRTADFGCLDIGVGMRLEFAVSGTVDCAWKKDARVASGLQTFNVFLSVGRITDDEQVYIGLYFFECFNNDMGVVFRLEPADIEEIPAWLHVKLFQNSRGFGPLTGGAVGDHDGWSSVFFQIIFANDVGV